MNRTDYFHIQASGKEESQLSNFKWLYVIAHVPLEATDKFEKKAKSNQSAFLGWADSHFKVKSTLVAGYELLASTGSGRPHTYKLAFTLHPSITAQGLDRKFPSRISSAATFLDLSDISWIGRKTWFSICLSESKIGTPLTNKESMDTFSRTLHDLLDRGKAIAIRWDHKTWRDCSKMHHYDYNRRYGRLPVTHNEAFFISERPFPRTTQTPYYWRHRGDCKTENSASLLAKVFVSPLHCTRLYWATKTLKLLTSGDPQHLADAISRVKAVLDQHNGLKPTQFTPRFWSELFEAFGETLNDSTIAADRKKAIQELVIDQALRGWLQGFKPRRFETRRDLRKVRKTLGLVWGYAIREWQALGLNESSLRSTLNQLDTYKIHEFDLDLARLIPTTGKDKKPLLESDDYLDILRHIRSNQLQGLKQHLQTILGSLGKEFPPPLEFKVYKRIEWILRKDFNDSEARPVFYSGMSNFLKRCAETKSFAKMTKASRFIDQRPLPAEHVDDIMESLLEILSTLIDELQNATTAEIKQSRLFNLTNILRTLGNTIASHEEKYRNRLASETFRVLQGYQAIDLIDQFQKTGNEAYAKMPRDISALGLGEVELCKASIARLYAILDPVGRKSPRIAHSTLVKWLEKITAELPQSHELSRYTYSPRINFGTLSSSPDSKEITHGDRTVKILGGLHFLGIHEHYPRLMTANAKETFIAILKFLGRRSPGPIISGLAFRTYLQAFSLHLIPRVKKTVYWNELTAAEQSNVDQWLSDCQEQLHEAVSLGAPVVYKGSKGHRGYLSHELGVVTAALISSGAKSRTIKRALKLLEQSFHSETPLAVRYTTSSTGTYSEKGSVARATTVHFARWLSDPMDSDKISNLKKALEQFTDMLPYLEKVTRGQTWPHSAHYQISNYYYFATIPYAATAASLLSKKNSSQRTTLRALNGSLERMLDPNHLKSGNGLPFVDEGHRSRVQVYTNLMASLTLQALDGNLLLGPNPS